MMIKVITLNIWEGGLRLPEVIAFLRQEQPDIIGLQEVYNGVDSTLPESKRSFTVLQSVLTEYHGVFSPELLHRSPEWDLEIGNALFSRFQPTSHQTEFFQPYAVVPVVENKSDWSRDPKNLHSIDIRVEETELRVINLHGIWGKDGNDNPARTKMGEVIIDHIKDQPNVIVMGDFNLLPHTQPVVELEKQLVNVFKNELTSTFNMKRKTNPGYATAVVDMMFVSPQFKIIDHWCPEVDISDHLPLVTVLEI